jgi:hypothetical protein
MSSAPIIRRGWLKKRDETKILRPKRNRYCVLDQGKLKFYRDILASNMPPFGQQLRGEVDLLGAKFVGITKSKSNPGAVKINLLVYNYQNVAGATKMSWEAESIGVANEWIVSIESHIEYRNNLMGVQDEEDVKKIVQESTKAIERKENGTEDDDEIVEEYENPDPNRFGGTVGYYVIPTPRYIMILTKEENEENVYVNLCVPGFVIKCKKCETEQDYVNICDKNAIVISPSSATVLSKALKDLRLKKKFLRLLTSPERLEFDDDEDLQGTWVIDVLLDPQIVTIITKLNDPEVMQMVIMFMSTFVSVHYHPLYYDDSSVTIEGL